MQFTMTLPISMFLMFAIGCGGSTLSGDAKDETLRSAFNDERPTVIHDSVPVGETRALALTRPSLTAVQIAETARAMSQVIVDEPIPLISSIPTDEFEAFEAAAATVEGVVWLTIDSGDQTLGFSYFPQYPSITVEEIERAKPTFTAPGVYPGVGRDAALEAAKHCGDELAEYGVVETQSYLRDPILERAPGGRWPTLDGAGHIEVTDHYHFVFGQAPTGILLGNSEMTIDVDAHSGECFRVEVAFIDVSFVDPVELVVSVDEAKAAVEGQLVATGGSRTVEDGRVLYWLELGTFSGVVEPRYVGTYSILTDNGLATHGQGFAVSLSQQPPAVVEF